MSDSGGDGRDDKSGKFVKRATQSVHDLNTPGDDKVHPLAKILFGWTEMKGMGTIIFWTMLVLSVLLIAIDLLVDRHDYFGFANMTGFYGVWGFIAFAFVVLMGWPLGRLLRRDEDYYGDASGPPDDIDPDIDPALLAEAEVGE
jgi:hypothetical protein